VDESDSIEFDYLDRTAWHKAGCPERLDRFYRTATLRLSPLPRLEGMERELVGESVRSWLGYRIRDRDKSKGVLGIEKIFDAAFELRPKSSKKSRRPYAFGSNENKIRYYQSSSILYAAYTEASEQFRSGRYNVSFPAGMYRPTTAMAA
jgi:hypothetical protein